jgi:D-alanine-D-alanine ligase
MHRVMIAYSPARIYHRKNGTPNFERDIISTVLEVEECLLNLGFSVKKAGIRRDLTKFLQELRRFKPTVIFNLCEEIEGDPSKEKSAVALYELLAVPFTGNGTLPLTVCLNKAITKRILKTLSIPTPPFKIFTDPGKEELPFPFPAIVKPLHEDGSMGITARSVVTSTKSLGTRIRYITKNFKQPALVEEFVPGRELQVSLLGNRNPRTLAVAELSYKGLPKALPRIVTYSAKWLTSSRYYKYTNPVIPAKIDDKLGKRVVEISKKIFDIFDLRGYARIDFRVDRNKPFVIDVNPNPDLSSDAGFAKAAKHAGLTYQQLIRKLVELAME